MVEKDKLRRFSRTELLVGPEGMKKLNLARVAVIGLGGVGSYTVEALARAGIGWLILADYDEISLTNTNRQIHALEGNYGRPKTEVMEERVRAINPEAVVVSRKEFLTAANIGAILPGDVSYVVDAVDTVSSKVALISFCIEHDIPVISAMGAGNKLDPLGFRVDDISRTHTCPLAKAVRKALREKGIERGVKVLYSTEKPLEPKREVPTCRQGCICPRGTDQPFNCAQRSRIPGSISYVPPIAGLIMAGEVIRDLLMI
ncbi:MAG: ThiF family adenylyltransferase [Bacillota bacterium]